jgi:hypothetical protein
MKSLRHQRDRLCVESGEIEQLIRQLREPAAVLVERLAKVGELLGAEVVPAEVERRRDSVDDRDRRSQLMGRERDELRLELVELLQLGEPRLELRDPVVGRLQGGWAGADGLAARAAVLPQAGGGPSST